jgi:hypothetical protein
MHLSFSIKMWGEAFTKFILYCFVSFIMYAEHLQQSGMYSLCRALAPSDLLATRITWSECGMALCSHAASSSSEARIPSLCVCSTGCQSKCPRAASKLEQAVLLYLISGECNCIIAQAHGIMPCSKNALCLRKFSIEWRFTTCRRFRVTNPHNSNYLHALTSHPPPSLPYGLFLTILL